MIVWGLHTIIDYFAVRKALRQTVADVKVIRGAEAGSDHYLVLMKMNVRWTRRKKEVRNEGTRLRLRKLLDWGELGRFQTELGKLFEKASDRVGEEVWKEFKWAILEVTERVVGRQSLGRQSFGKHRKATSWWSSDVKETVKREKWLYRKALNDKTEESWKCYKEAKKNAKQAVQEAKEKDLVREGKMLPRDYLGNRRRFWQKVKGEERSSKTSDSIEAKDGELLTGKEEVQRRWREHFSELFQNEGRDYAGEKQGDVMYNEMDDRILMEETRRAIGKLKSSKAGGVCGVRGEMLKAGGEVTVRWLTAISNVVWRTGVTPIGLLNLLQTTQICCPFIAAVKVCTLVLDAYIYQ